MKSSELRAPLGVEERKLVKAIKAFTPSGTDAPDAAVFDALKKTFSDKEIEAVKDYYHRLKTNGEDHSLEELAFRTEPFAVWSDARGVIDDDWGYYDGGRHPDLVAARSRISGT